jgi:lipid A oxidase
MSFKVAAGSVAITLVCHAAQAEVLLTLYTGVSSTRNTDLRISQPFTDSDATFESVSWRARPFEDAPYYGIAIAIFPGPPARLGGSFDFTHYKMYADTSESLRVHGRWNGSPVDEIAPLDTRIQNLEISHGVNLMTLNLLRRWSYPESRGLLSRFEPQIGVGLGGYGPRAEGSINGISSGADYHWAGEGFQLFAGGEYRFTRHLGIALNAKFDAGKLDIHLQPDARLQTHTRTLHAIGGLTVHF